MMSDLNSVVGTSMGSRVVARFAVDYSVVLTTPCPYHSDGPTGWGAGFARATCPNP